MPGHVETMCGLPQVGIESLAGYLARVGHACLWGCANRVAELAGLSSGERIWRPSDEDMLRLSQLLEIDSVELRAVDWAHCGKPAAFERYLNQTRPRICPVCISGSELARCEWELLPVTECQIHGVELIDTCQCGAPIAVTRQRLEYCVGCGESLGDNPIQPSKPDILAVSRLLSALAKRERWPQASGAAEEFIENIGFADFIELAKYLSGLVLRLDGRTDHRNRLDVMSWRQTIADAATIINDTWPIRFLEVIKGFEGKGPRSDRASMAKNFPYVYRSLYARAKGAWRHQLQDLFQDYVRANRSNLLLTLSSRDRMYARMGLAAEFSSIPTSAGELAATPTAIRRALDDLGMKPHSVRQGNGRTCQRITREQHLAIADEIERRPDVYRASGPGARRNTQGLRRRFLVERGLTVEQATEWFRGGRAFPSNQVLTKWLPGSVVALAHIADRLGVSVPTVAKLRDAGFFNSKPGTRRYMQAVVIDGYAAFESRLGECLARGPRSRRASIPFTEALLDRMRRFGVDFATLVQLVLDGEIAVIGARRDAKGLDRLRLSANDFARMFRRLQKQRFGDGLDQAEVAARLGLSDTSIVSGLTRAGLLPPSQPVQTPTQKLLYSDEDVEAFRRKFIPLREIAKRALFGRLSTPGAVAGWLRKQGIRPVCGPDVNKVPAIFFDRAEVESLSWRTRENRHRR